MGPLIIGFDASPIYGNKTGVEYYALRLYSTLKSELGKSGEIIAFSKEPIAEIPEAVILKSDLPLFLWRQIVLPRELKRRNVTSLHSPVTAIPLFTHCPSIATVHDVSYRIADKGISRNSKLTQILTCALAVRMARFIVPFRTIKLPALPVCSVNLQIQVASRNLRPYIRVWFTSRTLHRTGGYNDRR